MPASREQHRHTDRGDNDGRPYESCTEGLAHAASLPNEKPAEENLAGCCYAVIFDD